MKGWKKTFHANNNPKRARGSYSSIRQIDFKSKIILKDKEEHYILIKKSTHHEALTLINLEDVTIQQKYKAKIDRPEGRKTIVQS